MKNTNEGRGGQGNGPSTPAPGGQGSNSTRGFAINPATGTISANQQVLNFNSPYDYRGVWIKAEYTPSNSDTFTKYNWQFNVSMNGVDLGTKIDPNDFVNEGPFYFGELGSKYLATNSMYLPEQYPTMNFTGTITLYGYTGNAWTQIGAVTYGFNYNNGVVTPSPIAPLITYIGR